MNDNNVDCTKEPYCFASNDEDGRKNPLILSDSVYEHSANTGKHDGADEQLVVWKLENDEPDDNCNAIFDTNFNGTRENAVSSEEKTYVDEEQCDCILMWRRLKRYLELTDEELKRTHPSRYLFPEDIFTRKPIDLNNDDRDESLDDFQLDGEYLYAGLDRPNSRNVDAYNKKEAATSSAQENTRVVVMDERKRRPADVKTVENPAKNKNAGNKKINKNIKETKNTHAEVANNAAIVKKVPGNNSTTETDYVLNNDKQQRSKFGGQMNKLYAGGRKTGADRKTTQERMNTMKYVYTYGETYRGGIQCGHSNCVESPITIPQNKGWITDDFIINERKNKLSFKSGENPKSEKPTTQKNDAPKTTIAVAAAAAMDNHRHVVQRSKPNVVVNSHGVGHSTNSGWSKTKKVVVATAATAAAADTVGGSTASEVAGGGPNAKEAAAALEFVKKNGTYTITMNCLTSDGQLDAAAEPVVFRLAARTGAADAVSSSSSFELKCVTPNAVRATRPTKTCCKDACTSYAKEDFRPSKN